MDNSMDTNVNDSVYGSKKQKCGSNINSKINTREVANEFVEYFYKELNTNFRSLIQNNILREYTKVVFNSNEYTGENIITVFETISKENYNIFKIESIDSGSRAININVVGMTDNQIFSHSFLICNHKDSHWYLKNIIFI